MPENILQSTSEVDFSTPQKVQISFDEHIYDATIVLNNSKFEMNLNNEKALLEGAYICLTENSYKITYKEMVFVGSISDLTQSFLPFIIYDFLLSFEESILLDSYDKDRECFYVKKDIKGYFVTLECYKHNENTIYSMEIK